MESYVFRGWDVVGNKWVYGDLVHNQKVTRKGLEPRVMVGGYEVHPDSVGLKLESPAWGIEVYEGDIIRFHGRPLFGLAYQYYEGRVSFEMGCGCVIGEFGIYWLHESYLYQEPEVIGNIFERGDFGLSTDSPG